MTGTLEQVNGLLHEAGETHHQVFRIVDGADDDWASWYAQWLIDLSELPDLLGVRPVRSELIYLLVSLDRQFTAEATGEPWESYYARQIQRHSSQQAVDNRSLDTHRALGRRTSCHAAPGAGCRAAGRPVSRRRDAPTVMAVRAARLAGRPAWADPGCGRRPCRRHSAVRSQLFGHEARSGRGPGRPDADAIRAG